MGTTEPEGWSPINWWKFTFLRNYANFRGRARRREYGMFHLVLLGGFVLGVFALAELESVSEAATDVFGPIFLLYLVASLMPYIAVTVRRLHDMGMSTWWLLVGIIPFVGLMLQIALLFGKGVEGTNRWSQDPKQYRRTEEARAPQAPLEEPH